VPYLVTTRAVFTQVLLALLITLGAGAPAGAQDELLKRRAEYQAESDPVDKAKKLARLGAPELAAARALVREGDEEQALAVLEKYRDAVRETTETLTVSGIDAVRRPGGFKELQISLRQSIGRIEDLILSLQQEVRPWFRAVRSDLEAAENALIDELFPAPPPRRPRTTSSQ
jgi:hypothetical protein